MSDSWAQLRKTFLEIASLGARTNVEKELELVLEYRTLSSISTDDISGVTWGGFKRVIRTAFAASAGGNNSYHWVLTMNEALGTSWPSQHWLSAVPLMSLGLGIVFNLFLGGRGTITNTSHSCSKDYML